MRKVRNCQITQTTRLTKATYIVKSFKPMFLNLCPFGPFEKLKEINKFN